MTEQQSARQKPLLSVYYDGAAPGWRLRIALYRLEASRHGIAIAWHDLAWETDALAEHGIAAGERRHSLYVAGEDGLLFHGAGAYALLWSTLPSRRRMARLLRVPAALAAVSDELRRRLGERLAGSRAGPAARTQPGGEPHGERRTQ